MGEEKILSTITCQQAAADPCESGQCRLLVVYRSHLCQGQKLNVMLLSPRSVTSTASQPFCAAWAGDSWLVSHPPCFPKQTNAHMLNLTDKCNCRQLTAPTVPFKCTILFSIKHWAGHERGSATLPATGLFFVCCVIRSLQVLYTNFPPFFYTWLSHKFL